MTEPVGEDDRRRRWRLLLGEAADEALETTLSPADVGMDRTLGALYDGDADVKKVVDELKRRGRGELL